MLLKPLDDQPETTNQVQPISTISSTLPKTKKKRGLISRKLIFSIFGIFLVLVIAFGLFSYFFVYQPAKNLSISVKKLEVTALKIQESAKSQNLETIGNDLVTLNSDLENVRSTYKQFAWANYLPILKNYYQDGLNGLQGGSELLKASEISVEAIAPYADLLGLKGLATGPNGGKTAQDRIDFIVNTLDKIQPQLSTIGEHLSLAQASFAKIDSSRYPEEIKGKKIRSNILLGQNLIGQAASLVNDAKPLLESAPYILGIDSPRKYLVLFQNDAEIRPTGGFLTGYSVIQISKGKISTIQSDDIYKLDELFPKKIPAPEAIKKYHPLVPYWYLRDQNLSPDFRVSMETFFPNYKLTKSPSVDGIIAVDTQMLVELLKITGPIGVPNLGTFSANTDPRCDCPQVFYELQLLAGGEEPVVWDSVSGKIVKAPANYLNRKAFLGPLMYSVLANVMAQPKAKVPEMVNTVFNAIAAKHVLLYFPDTKTESAAEAFNIAGRVKETEGDYLMVVDTNFSGAKTNIWVTYKADQKIDISSDGTVTKTLTLAYSNPQSKAVKITQARNLNGLFRDWVRIYVPKGTKLLEGNGFEEGMATSDDLGKTVIEGFFTLAPGNTRQITLKYQLPFKAKSPYSLSIQKQGGTKVFPYTTSINGKSKPEVLLDADKDLVYPY